MIVNNIAATSVSFTGKVPRPGAVIKMPDEVTPAALKELLEKYAPKTEVDQLNTSLRYINESLRDKVEGLTEQVKNLENGQADVSDEQIQALTKRIKDLEDKSKLGKQSQSVMEFIKGHKVAVGVTAAAVLAAGVAVFAYSKHKKTKAAEEAASPARYTPPAA